MPFHSTGPHFCTECPAKYGTVRSTGERVQTGVKLTLTEANASGCGADMASCPKCGRGYEITYTVAAINRAPDWDVEIVVNHGNGDWEL